MRKRRGHRAGHGTMVSPVFLPPSVSPHTSFSDNPINLSRTDGISWSASRIAQEFLFYRQRDTDPDSSHSSAQWANIMKCVAVLC